MNALEVIAHSKTLRSRIQQYGRDGESGGSGDAALAQVCEFLRRYAGPTSQFTVRAHAVNGFNGYVVRELSRILDSFAEYLDSGLSMGLSPERQAQIDVVSDFLEQAQQMLDTPGIHPAAPAVLIGGALEEFLRSWVEVEGLALDSGRPGIDLYAKALRARELISKQDMKDITAWAGTRNHAAHGQWEEVGNADRVRLMLEGVNLFMRQKSAWGQPDA